MKRVFPKGTSADAMAAAVTRMVQGLAPDRVWAVEVSEWKKPRTNQQNAYLWGVVYPMVLEAGGEALAGWTRDDLHEYFLGEVWGWETLEGFGKKRLRPLKRTSRMTAAEFTEYLHGIENRLMDLGIGPLPEPIYNEVQS
jgi:hypothetical protein